MEIVIVILLVIAAINTWKRRWKWQSVATIVLAATPIVLDNINHTLANFVTDEFIWAIIILACIIFTFLSFFKPIATAKFKEE